MTFTEAVAEGVVAECIERGVTTLQALHGLSRDRCRSTTTSSSTSCTMAKRHGGLVTRPRRERRRHHRAAPPGPGRRAHRRVRALRAPGRRCSRARPSPGPRRWPRSRRHRSTWSTCRRRRRSRPLRDRPGARRGRLRRDLPAVPATSTPTGWPTPTARTSCARPRCATRGTARSCGRAWPAGWLHTVATDHCPFWVADRHAGMQGATTAGRTSPRSPAGCPASRPASP